MLLLLPQLLAVAAPAIAADVRRMTVADDGFAADFFPTDHAQESVGVLVLGGSEGGKPIRLAKDLAHAGYPALALAYFRAPDTPDALDMIPLDYVDKPIAWLSQHMGAGGKGIVVVGGSKGAELALLLASRDARICGVIATAPSSVVFQGIPKVFFPPRSSWSNEGEPVPFVPYDLRGGVDPKKLLSLYERSLKQKDAVDKASIAVENIGGPILLLSGSDDKMWPSATMAAAICERLDEHEFPHPYEHVDYPDAGHTLNEFFMLGGTKQGNKQARLDSRKRMLEFLHEIKAKTESK